MDDYLVIFNRETNRDTLYAAELHNGGTVAHSLLAPTVSRSTIVLLASTHTCMQKMDIIMVRITMLISRVTNLHFSKMNQIAYICKQTTCKMRLSSLAKHLTQNFGSCPAGSSS